MPKLPVNQVFWTVRISMDGVSVRPDGTQITQCAFVADATDGSPSTLQSSLDFARNYLEAAGWRCSQIDLTTQELSTPKQSLRQLLSTIDKNSTDSDDSETKGSVDTSNSWDTTRASAWALQNLS